MDLIEILRDKLNSSGGQDIETRLVLADALEEIGRAVEANGQRWQSLHEKRPLVMNLKGVFKSKSRAGWFSCKSLPANETASVVLLEFENRDSGWVWFKTLDEAELALAETLANHNIWE